MSPSGTSGRDAFQARKKMSGVEGKYSAIALWQFYRGQNFIFYVSVLIALWGFVKGD